ncbi:MAG: serine/threonine protein kinase [Persicimonas sp.]
MENLQGGTLALEHRYDVVERAGRHGFITLYRGRQDPFAKDVWLKVYDGLETAAAPAELFERLKEAARRAALLQAPGVLRVVDYGEVSAGVPFVVSERIDAEPLSAMLEREGTLSVDQTAELLLRLADVLEPIHRQGLAHGGLDPRWVYLPDGEASQARLDHVQLALTVADIRSAENAVMDVEAISAFAPEMFEGPDKDPGAAGQRFGTRTDIWAMGVIAYKALVGVHPFFEDELDASEGLIRLKNDRARPLSEMGIDEELSQAVDRALQKKPAARFDSVVDFARAFATAAGVFAPEDPSSEQPTADPSPSKRPPADRHRAQPRPDSLDAPVERAPGPADHLVTIALMVLFLSNLAWLFYVATR